jgi:lysine-ketoglutarate reductase/saccharopine dehydrogenase-like protein (TIGR00300 family)
MYSETLEAHGHLIDSGDLQAILTTVVDHGARYEIVRFDVGRTNDDASQLELRVHADTAESLRHLLEKLSSYGCYMQRTPDAHLRTADLDGAAPEDFYSTTNHGPKCGLNGGGLLSNSSEWMRRSVERRPCRSVASCLDIRAGDLIVCGMHGVHVMPDVQSRDRPTFGFMSNEVSSERRVETAVGRVAEMMRAARARGGRIAFVAGPVVVHTGGTEYFCELIGLGYVNLVLSGNALAVHDIELAFSGTSLGIDLSSGQPVEHGHRNHMRAINAVRRAGGIGPAVDSGVLRPAPHACHSRRPYIPRLDTR